MNEDRIKTEITFGYKAINASGEVTLELKPTTLIVADQSPEKASKHLLNILEGIAGPAREQIS